MDEAYDVVVVGGGAAGLSGAMALARSRRSVLVVDAGEPRNAPAGHVHNYLGREAAAPGAIYATGREEVARYGGEVVAGRVLGATPVPGDGPAFTVQLDGDRSVRARRLLLATGMVDDLPDVEGLAARWGRDVVHCPYCHGWEVRDQAIGILGGGPMTMHAALMWRQLSDDVTVFRGTWEPDDEQTEQLAARGIGVVEGEVVALEVTDDRLTGVRLASGQVVPREALVAASDAHPRADLLAALGLEATDVTLGEAVLGSQLAVDPMGATAVPGIFAAGNVSDLRATVIASAASGLAAGAAINMDLITEDTRAAVASRREGSGAAVR